MTNRLRLSKILFILAIAPLAAVLCSCGYHMAGEATRVPPDVKTIAIPAFTNKSPHFRIEQIISEAVMHEFIERTNYHVVPEISGADAVLEGVIKSTRAGPVTFDPTTGRATTYQIQVISSVELRDLHSKKVIFSNPNYVFREEYQVSQSAPALFEEDQPALQRLSQDFARTLVTDILENF